MRRVVAFGILALVLSTALLESGWAQQTVHPSTTAPQTTVQAPAPPSLKATTRAGCNMIVGILYTRRWIRSCRLRGMLTDECKQIFDSEGGYSVPERGGTNRVQQWTDDAKACACELPPDIAAQLNESLKSDQESSAARFPEPSKE